MTKKRLAPLTVNELHYLLKKHPELRDKLDKLHLKLTASARLVAIKKSRCEPLNFKPTLDPIILKRGALKSGK
jgi:hypothetical protein